MEHAKRRAPPAANENARLDPGRAASLILEGLSKRPSECAGNACKDDRPVGEAVDWFGGLRYEATALSAAGAFAAVGSF